MKKIALLASLAFLLSCNQDETAFGSQTANEFHSSISGKVTDRSGRPMIGAMVTARPGGATATTNSDGKFVLAGVASGSYRIDVAKDDYRDTMWLDSVRVGLSEARDVGTIGILYRYATVTGVVVDSVGSTQSRAGIAVEDQTPTVTASGDGKFVLDRIEPGPVRLFSAVQNVGYGTLDTILRPDDTLKNVRLRIVRRGGVVVGYIIDTDGKPVANAVVEAMGGALKATTNAQGRFEMSEVPSDGKVLVEVSENGRTATVTGVRVGEASQTSIDTIRIAAPTSGDELVVLPGLAIGFTTDSVVALVVGTSLSDTSFHVRRYLWSVDNGSTWDTTTVNVLPVQPKRLGWGEGTHPVLVKVVALDGRVSPTTTMFVRLIPPPDWTSPVVKRISPSRDTTLSWNDSSLTLSWRITDNRKVDSVWIGGLLVSGSGDVYSRKVDLVVGRNTVSLRARDVAGNISRDSIVVTRRGLNSQDTTLDSLKVSKGTLSPRFSKDMLSYTDTVSSSDSTVTVSAWASDTSMASVWIGDSKTDSRVVNLEAAGTSTQVRVFVIAKDGDTLEYDVSVWRPSASAVVQDSTFGIPWNSAISYGVLNDSRDEQSYRTVKIGTQTWMAENLNYKGSGIDSGWWYNNSADSGAKYGRYYTWATTMGLPDSCNTKVCASQVQARQKGICPSGWYVPSDSEWTVMEKFVDASNMMTGTQLKSTSGWSTNRGTDTYGFRALPGGRIYGGNSIGLGYDGSWWSAGLDRDMHYDKANVYRNDYNKIYGFSVRCLEDVTVLDTSTTLTSLSVDSGKLAKLNDTLYADTISATLTKLTIVAKAASASATITYNGSANNVVAIPRDTVISMKVTNGNGSRTYKINVYHKTGVVADSTFGIPWNSAITYGILNDARDGQSYRTVKIGTQTWMAENLAYKGEGKDSGWAPNSSLDSGAKYGRLYNWATVAGLHDTCNSKRCADQIKSKHKGICPENWSVPGSYEWMVLQQYADSANISAGKRLKSTTGWQNLASGTDDYGFRAIPAGMRYTKGDFDKTDKYARWWTSSEVTYANASQRNVGAADFMDVFTFAKTMGFSVRCVQGGPEPDTVAPVVVRVSPAADSVYPQGTQTVQVTWKVSDNYGIGPVTIHGKIVKPDADGNATASIALPDTVVNMMVSIDASDLVGKHARDTIRLAWIDSNYGAPWNSAITYGLLTDARDGQSYRTVRIGTQNWMAENLNYQVDSSWWYENSTDSGKKYGRLYQWSSAMNLDDSCSRVSCAVQVLSKHRGACPEGWHIPSDSEWTILQRTVDPDLTDEGRRLKASGSWDNVGNGSDSLGFRGLPGGWRYAGKFEVSVSSGKWWSATDFNAAYVWMRTLTSSSERVNSNGLVRNAGLSIRCLQGL